MRRLATGVNGKKISLIGNPYISNLITGRKSLEKSLHPKNAFRVGPGN